MPTRLLSIFLLGLSLLASASQAALSDAEALNMAGMQRMLSQRIAKNYLMIGADVRTDQAAQQLDESLATFESNYQALNVYAPTPDIRQALASSEETWRTYRELALSSPDRKNAVQILALSDRLLADSERVVQLVEAHSGNRASQLVNRSGRQRMLSQRIATLYLALSWKLPVDGLEANFNQAVAEFDQALHDLIAAQQNTAAINKALEQANAQWRYARAGFRLSADSRYVPTVIATTTETLLRQMNELTSQYEGVMRSGS